MSAIARRLAAVAVAGLLAGSGGCGELTSGGVGEVEVYATADESGSAGGESAAAAEGAPAAAPHARGSGAPGRAPASAAAEGQLAVEMRVFLRADSDGGWVEITEGVRDLTLDLSGGSSRRVGVRFLSSGRYSGLRVVFQSVRAFVSGGLTIDGLPFTGTVTVDLAGEPLTVEREVLVEVEGDASVDLLLDLNADLWLPTLAPATRTVAAAELESALAVRVR